MRKWLEQFIRRMVAMGFASVLRDVDYRISILRDLLDRAGIGPSGGPIHATDLRLAHHMLDGFTFTSNSPIAGSIAWASVHIVFNGTDYTINDGNTALKYIWWDFSLSTTTFQVTDTKPTMVDEDVLVVVNDGGTYRLVMTPGKFTPGQALFDGSVDSAELKNLAVTSGKLASAAVIAGKIAAAAVDASNLFASGVVDSTALGASAVTAGKIATGGISAAGQFAAGVVDNAAIGTAAVNTDELAANAVTTVKIGAGQVATAKLNLASHLIY